MQSNKRNTKIVLLTNNKDGFLFYKELSKIYDVEVILERLNRKYIVKQIKRNLKRIKIKDIIIMLSYPILTIRVFSERLSAETKRDKLTDDICPIFVDNHNDDDCNKVLKSIKPDFIIIVGTRLIKSCIFRHAKYGAINFHSGILPKYKGGETIFSALKNKDYDNIGYTFHYIDEGLDTGNILKIRRFKVKEDDTELTLFHEIIEQASKDLPKLLKYIIEKKITPIAQDKSIGSYYKLPSLGEIVDLRKKNILNKT